jgi:Flp pilus assembly protein CpaB
MQGRGRFFIILGVVLLALAIVGGLLIVVLQGRGGGTPAAPSAETPGTPGATEVAPETRDVVVALQNIGEGEKIRPDAVGVRPVAVDKLPEQPILDPSDVVNKLARQDIYQQDVLVDDMVIAVEDVQRLGGRAASLVPAGKVAVAFPVSQLSSVNYAIQAGDQVDILVSGSFVDVDVDAQIETPLVYIGGEDCQPGCQIVGEQVPRTFSQLTIDDAKVLGIGTWGQPPSPPSEGEGEEGEPVTDGQPSTSNQFDSVILIVSPQDSVVLKYLRENGYVIDLALRSREDMDSHRTEPVTLEYIMTRFSISPPTKLPYRLKAMEAQITIPLDLSPPPAE